MRPVEIYFYLSPICGAEWKLSRNPYADLRLWHPKRPSTIEFILRHIAVEALSDTVSSNGLQMCLRVKVVLFVQPSQWTFGRIVFSTSAVSATTPRSPPMRRTHPARGYVALGPLTRFSSTNCPRLGIFSVQTISTNYLHWPAAHAGNTTVHTYTTSRDDVQDALAYGTGHLTVSVE